MTIEYYKVHKAGTLYKVTHGRPLFLDQYGWHYSFCNGTRWLRDPRFFTRVPTKKVYHS